MSTEDRDRSFFEQVRKSLDESVAGLDDRTVARLRDIRVKTLEAAGRENRAFFRPARWVTAGGLAAAAVLIVAVSIWFNGSRQTVPGMYGEDTEIIASREHFELYEELDFYRWLAAGENAD